MCLCKWLRAVAVTAACMGIVFPDACLYGQTPGASTPCVSTVDVALDPAGHLVATIVDGTGQPQPGYVAIIRQHQGQAVRAEANMDGELDCTLPGGGIYSIQVGEQSYLVRCWAHQTAPPHAVERLLLASDATMRAQIHPAACSLGNPWLITGIVVAAIVIPIAIHNHREDREFGS